MPAAGSRRSSKISPATTTGWESSTKRRDLLGENGDGLLNTVKETVGEHVQGTWAEDAWNTVKDATANGGDGFLDKFADTVGEHVQGTWAQDAWNTVKDAVGDGGGGLLDQIGGGNVAEVLGKPAGSTFGEQAWNQVTDLFGAGTAAPASPADPGMGTAGPASPLGPAAATTTAQSLGQPAADTGDDILGRGIVPPHLDPAQQAPAGAGVRPIGPAAEAATSGPASGDAMTSEPAAADAATSPMMPTPEAPATSEPAMPVDEPMADPVMDAAPADEPSQFDASMAAADQVEASVDDLFVDIG